ncbi:U3 small nucleolar RNA-associated protein 14 homolog A [Pistacia vera]|uniref:U3 small nucleolar RNA-associated protein 14 homolog A n=1 Tax=Pistacia vera TaxID=55513 RepID=UPI0012633B36|nr:U3 small nucleolar RNA-associated protein 14 homolog A [Pistacia vera]XP_031256153.1 U3 small nucleolar RNA-associated protein 14 homolog A [Pistacia vera]
MADKKRKTPETTNHRAKSHKNQKKNSKKVGGGEMKRKRSGPRLPNSMRKELDRLNRTSSMNNSDDEDIDSYEGNDFYEYEEPLPQEESKKNRRYDSVDNYEYQLPENFKDENVLSDDDDDDENDYNGSDDGASRIENTRGRTGSSKQLGDEVEDEDDERHLRMLQGITGMPSEVFEGKKTKKKNIVISEAYTESEFNPSRDVLDGNSQITIEDLLEPLQGKAGYSKLRKRMHQMDKKSVSIQAPLPKVEREKLERKAVYEHSKKDITKWEPLVKMNREAPTIIFEEDTNLGFSTVGAIASGFEPRTEFEKKMASLVNDEKVVEAHKEDGARLLEMNKVSVEDYLEDRNHIAKMRSLLFRHEMKSKRIKKIKSKTYHRLLKKDRLKGASAEFLMDPEAAKEEARKQEFKRAEERMTLKHKNSSKWAKRILKRGLNAQDEGTRAALAEQLHQHALLTRKMNSMKDSSSSSGSGSDEEDVDRNSADSEEDGASNLFAKAKEKTLKVLEEEDEVPNSGVLSLPFMMRGMKKRKEEAIEEAKLALQEYESSLKELEGTVEEENSKVGVTSGRRIFGAAQKEVPEPNHKIKTDNYYGNSDSEDDLEPEENLVVGNRKKNDLQKDVSIDSALLNEGLESHQDSVFKSFDEVVRDPGPKTSHDVSIFASGTWKKMKSGNTMDTDAKKPKKVVEPVLDDQSLEVVNEESDTDSDDGKGEMVDGIMSSEPKASYKLPSQEELIRLAFAGDDVEEDFEKDKEKILTEENPVPEKPHLLPGWGQWTNLQQKKGLPSWMVEEHENAKKRREEALKKRKDARLKHVIISEKLDKKAEKLHTKTLPYPFTSKEVFERSIRVPVGPEFNPATAVGALNQPEVKKKSGIIIKPIKFEEVNPHEKTEEHKSRGQKQKMNKNKSDGSKRPKSRPVVVKIMNR